MLSAGRDADIAVQATHQHMRTDQRHLIYSHFWSTGATARLTNGPPGALDHVDGAEAAS